VLILDKKKRREFALPTLINPKKPNENNLSFDAPRPDLTWVSKEAGRSTITVSSAGQLLYVNNGTNIGEVFK